MPKNNARKTYHVWVEFDVGHTLPFDEADQILRRVKDTVNVECYEAVRWGIGPANHEPRKENSNGR